MAKSGKGSEGVARCINKYFQMMVKIISSGGGDVLKFAGDAMIVLWPEDDKDPLAVTSQDALSCGLERLRDVKNEDTSRKYPRFCIISILLCETTPALGLIGRSPRPKSLAGCVRARSPAAAASQLAFSLLVGADTVAQVRLQRAVQCAVYIQQKLDQAVIEESVQLSVKIGVGVGMVNGGAGVGCGGNRDWDERNLGGCSP